MKILAITTTGTEYLYSMLSVHAVSVASAEKIRSALNNARFRLRDGETWYLYDVGPLDPAYDLACMQRFTVRSGRIFERRI